MNMKEASKSLAKTIRLTLSTLSSLDSGSKTSSSPPPTKIRVSNILDSVRYFLSFLCLLEVFIFYFFKTISSMTNAN